MNTRLCNGCMKTLPLVDFYPTTAGYTHACKGCFFKTSSNNPYRENYYDELLYSCSLKYNVPAAELKLCKGENIFKPKSRFCRDLMSDDGYTDSCSKCLYGSYENAGKVRAVSKRIINLSCKDVPFLTPIPAERFMNMNLVRINDKRCVVTEEEIKLHNLYFIPQPSDRTRFEAPNAADVMGEFCDHEPASSFMDFLVAENENHKKNDYERILCSL